MANNPRRRRVRREQDVSGQYRVTIPDTEELDQLRTRGESIEGGCIQYLPKMEGLPLGPDPYPAPLGSHLQNQWIPTRLGEYLRRFTVDLSG